MKMDISMLEFNKVVSKNLFYNKYKYKARFKLQGAYVLYSNIKTLEQLERYFKNMEKAINHRGIEVKEIAIFVKFIEEFGNEFTTRVEGSNVSVFTNNTSRLAELNKLFTLFELEEVEHTEGVIYFKSVPKFKYRTYLKNFKRNKDYSALEAFIQRESSKQNINCSGVLKTGFSNFIRNFMTQKYFVDYNDEGVLTYLNIIQDDVVGPTYKLLRKA